MPRGSPEFEDANAMNVDGQEKNSNDEGSDNEEEYEIEEILKAKRGVFGGSGMAYFVKWKGYGPEDNSWVNEEDASNAKELVDEFWRKNARKGKQQSSGPKRGRKSAAADEESGANSVAKKRGYKSTIKVDSDEDEPAKGKKAKRALAKGRESERVHDMAKYMNEENWEDLVDTIDTVERTEDGLMVYFTLKNGETVRERGDICRKRFPQQLLVFYESNLKWRTAEANQDD